MVLKRIQRRNAMKIQKIIDQHRRDFNAVYECEYCGHTERILRAWVAK